MQSTTLRTLPLATLQELLEQCDLPQTKEGLLSRFQVAIIFSGNDKGEKFATLDTRDQDARWWHENRHTKNKYWRESSPALYCFTDYSDSEERSLYMVALRAINPTSCARHLAFIVHNE